MTVNAACANFRPPPAPVPEAMAGSPPAEIWAVRAGRGITGPVAASGSRIWMAGADRQVRALSVDSARLLWMSRLPGMGLGGVLLRDSVLYVATARPEGRIIALQAGTGKGIWRTSAGEVSTPLGISGELIGAVNRRGELVALNLLNGRLRWRRRVGLSRVAPAGVNGAFIVSTGDSLLRIETTAGRTTHRRASPGTVLEDWQPLGNLLVAPTGDSLLVAMDPRDLHIAWQVSLDAPALGRPAVRGDTVWVVSRIGTVYETVGGAPARRVARLGAPITSGISLVGDLLVAGGADGVLRAVRRDGRPAWRMVLSWNITVNAIALPDGFAALGGDGDLHRYRQ
jgi:outer membrane protein assembly factor BamB